MSHSLNVLFTKIGLRVKIRLTVLSAYLLKYVPYVPVVVQNFILQ